MVTPRIARAFVALLLVAAVGLAAAAALWPSDIVKPTPIAVALATAVGAAERFRGRPSELNAETVGYLTRTGGYSRAKAERLLGWVPQISLSDGMARTEEWLRAEGYLARSN